MKDSRLAGLLALGSLALYAATAAPSVATVFDDSLEFQVVLPTLGIAHPSGYPLYTLLGKLFTLALPFRDPAGRANLLSAVAAAAAVGCFYLLAVRWAKNRAAAAIVTIAFAISPIWWSQATLAEVYALHGLLVALLLYCLLGWEEALSARRRTADRWLAAAALAAGLGLAHHRMIALLLPAALVFVLWTAPDLWRQPRRWLLPLACGLTPLLLYAYLPLRGQAVSSLDGTFQPTLSGLRNWIMASGYDVFLTGNPFGVHRTAGFFVGLVLGQLGPLLLLAAAGGLALGWRYGPRRYVLLLVATLAQVAFGVAYKVQDVEVFWLPAIMLLGLWAALGLVPWLDAAAVWAAGAARRLGPPAGAPGRARPWLLAASLLLAGLMLFEPVRQAVIGFPAQDRSHAWQIYDEGQDMLASVAPDGEIVGLQGEVTLARYMRDVLGERPDVVLVAADAEGARRQAVAGALAANRPVYLTRNLPSAASHYSLDAAGPLIRVSPKSQPVPAPAAVAGGEPMGRGISLVAAKAGVRTNHTGPVVRVTADWTTSQAITEALKISARLVAAGDRAVAPPKDEEPVHFTYPTTAWVPGETVQDVYDIAVPGDVPAGEYRVLLILYRAADGSEVGRARVGPVTIER